MMVYKSLNQWVCDLLWLFGIQDDEQSPVLCVMCFLVSCILKFEDEICSLLQLLSLIFMNGMPDMV
jgi:hypothetical protein